MSRAFREKGSPAEVNGYRPTALEFWRWAYSDLLQNTTRGVVAEYLVAVSLGLQKTPRHPWAAADLMLPEGTRIEVKTTSLLQAWPQERLSKPLFVLGPTRHWGTDTGEMSPKATWNADLYVLCFFTPDRYDQADVMDLSLWRFYVLSRYRLKKLLGNRKSITVAKLEQGGIIGVQFSELAAAVRSLKAHLKSASRRKRTG